MKTTGQEDNHRDNWRTKLSKNAGQQTGFLRAINALCYDDLRRAPYSTAASTPAKLFDRRFLLDACRGKAYRQNG